MGYRWIVAGSYNAKATEVFQEGLRIPPLRVMTKDGVLSEVMDLITYNTRNPEMLNNDLLAQSEHARIGAEPIEDTDRGIFSRQARGSSV